MAENVDLDLERQQENKTLIDRPAEGLKRINSHVSDLNKELGKEVYNSDEISLGFVLNTITGDDQNIFGPGVGYQELPQAENPSYYPSAKIRILGRLDWEIGLDLVPERLKARLREVRGEMSGYEWNRGTFMQVYDVWKTKILNLVEEDPELSKINKDYQEFNKKYEKSNARIVNVLKEYEEIYKSKAVEMGLDPEAVSLGNLMDKIAGDDANAFQSPFAEFSEIESQRAKEMILIRTEWELNSKNIPQKLKERILETRKKLEEFDWNNKEEFRKFYNFWRKNLRDWLIKERETDPVLKKAEEDFLKVYREINRLS